MRDPNLAETAAGPQTTCASMPDRLSEYVFSRLVYTCLSDARIEGLSVLSSRGRGKTMRNRKEGKNCSQTSDPLDINDTAYAMPRKKSHWAERCG